MQAFFLHVRLGIASREEPGQYHNLYKSFEDFEARSGAKLRGLAYLSVHCLGHDDVAMPHYRRGHPIFWPADPPTPNPGKRKIIVMHEFTMMAELIASASLPVDRRNVLRF